MRPQRPADADLHGVSLPLAIRVRARPCLAHKRRPLTKQTPQGAMATRLIPVKAGMEGACPKFGFPLRKQIRTARNQLTALRQTAPHQRVRNAGY